MPELTQGTYLVPPDPELERIKQRYARREELGLHARYAPLLPENLYAAQRRQWHWARLLRRWGRFDPATARVLEIGCGTGTVLMQLAELGIPARSLVGLELLAGRCRAARDRLPLASILQADAGALPMASASFDVVVQSTVFSSILAREVQQRVAQEMLRILKPGGAILWCDLAIDNPKNPDVRSVPLGRIRALFPGASVHARRAILALPLLRRMRWGLPGLALALETVPLLCGHWLAVIVRARGVAAKRGNDG